MKAILVKEDLKKVASKEKEAIAMRYFKTAKGDYGEGDIFLGVTVPMQRKIALKYKEISLKELEELISSPIHEHRLTCLLILVENYKRGNNKEEIVKFYLKHRKYINNWDLVDSSADKILGEYLFEKDKKILYDFVKSENLWERRIAIITTFYFIRKREFEDTFRIATLLLKDKHDLIHKAVGWMLREVGKKSKGKLEEFLQKNYHRMPRTMLRYAIEHFDEKQRKKYLEIKRI